MTQRRPHHHDQSPIVISSLPKLRRQGLHRMAIYLTFGYHFLSHNAHELIRQESSCEVLTTKSALPD